jgi:TPR repeat protein
MGKGLTAIAEVDRLSPYTDFNDIRLRPLLKTAKESFELALEIEKDNTAAMLWLARLHLHYNILGACLRSGANLLETAADAGLADAQYELACRIRSEGALLGDDDPMDDRIFKYLESAACQKHAGALFLVGAIYLSGRHVRRDPQAAAWCFRKAAEQVCRPVLVFYFQVPVALMSLHLQL